MEFKAKIEELKSGSVAVIENTAFRRITLLGKGHADLIDVMGDELAIVNAAKVSYSKHATKLTKNNIKLIKYLWDHRHTTPFEMVEFKFRVKVPIFIRAQWHRHRTWSYNEISRRYTSDDMGFHIPETFRKQAEKNKQGSEGEFNDSENEAFRKEMESITKKCFDIYDKWISLGMVREQARMILPQNMWTEYYAKVDLHNLLHFLRLRLDPHAQYEIRVYAEALLELITPIVPNVVEFFKESLDYDI